jgi:hypothetical protein
MNKDKIEEYYQKNKEAKENLTNSLKFLKVAQWLLSQVTIKGKVNKKLNEE